MQKKNTNKRILLVEDNEINSDIARHILEEVEIVVEIAENGRIAVDKIMKEKSGYYDLILMDIQMPIMDGYEATKRIRALKDEKKSRIPIIAMTANSFEEDRRMEFEAGMDAHISKPIVVKDFLHEVDEYL